VLLLLDEPNSALDAEGSEALNHAVRGFKSMNRAVVIMTHRPTAISECDLLLVIDAGRATAFGPRDDVLKSVTQNAKTIQSAMGKGATS
jgi:ATP-binding cassette subfamily C protein